MPACAGGVRMPPVAVRFFQNILCCVAALVADGKVTSLNAAVVKDDLNDSFPIITGCLNQCGNAHPACVSQCQVCVEMNNCRTVDRHCNSCMEEVRSMRMEAKNASNLAEDSGGTALTHEGYRTQLYAQKRQQLVKERQLIDSRDDVLQAQRQAEWAQLRRAEAVHKVKNAQGKQQNSEARVSDWQLRHDKKVDNLEGEEDERRTSRQSAKNELKEARAELKAAKRRLKQSRKHQRSERQEDVQAAKEREWKLQQEVDTAHARVSESEKATDSKRQDADWVDRELKQESQGAQGDVLVAKEELRKVRAVERHSRESLESAKNRYRRVTAERQRADEAVEKLEEDLDEHPLPTFDRRSTTTAPREADHTVHDGSSLCRPGFFTALIVVLWSFVRSAA